MGWALLLLLLLFFLRAGGSSLGMGTHSKMAIDDNFISVPLNRLPSCLLGIEDEAQLHSDGLRCSTFLQCEHSILCKLYNKTI